MSESNGNGLSSRERNLSGLPDDREIIFAYLDSLDLTDKLLLRDQYYLFCGGIESKEERAITKILDKRGIKGTKYQIKGSDLKEWL